MKFNYLFVLLAAASVRAKVVDLNKETDTILDKANHIARFDRKTLAVLPPGVFENVTYSENVFTGLDSLVRTDNCTLTTENSTFSFDFHYGLGLWLQTFRGLSIGDSLPSSGYIRVRSNSVRAAFTLYNETRCRVTVDTLAYEKLENVELGSSDSQFDGINVDNYFKQEILPACNKILKAMIPRIERKLKVLCNHRDSHLFNSVNVLPQILAPGMLYD